MRRKAKNVSNSREIEKLIQSFEEDISFGKEVKGELKTSSHGQKFQILDFGGILGHPIVE